ncbi:MAG: MDR family oxidoreductase [bacterium]
MSESKFLAWMLSKGDGKPTLQLEELQLEDLPGGDVLVEVHWSSLNYKDALALTGRGKIARRFPLVPGIDLAGLVRESSSPDFKPGDEVLVCSTGGIGATYWGGYAGFARVPAASLVPVPPALGMRRTMAIGTAGYTAALAVNALVLAGMTCEPDKPVVVTGASGGLGGVAIMLLARAGYTVAASTGRPENDVYLRRLGAAEIIPRSELERQSRPLETQRWAGAVDAVGGNTLATILAETWYGGSVASCGLAAGSELNTTVMPFILRAVSLLGIDAVYAPETPRRRAWDLLAGLPGDLLDEMTSEAALRELPGLADKLLAGQIRGRIVIDVRRSA